MSKSSRRGFIPPTPIEAAGGKAGVVGEGSRGSGKGADDQGLPKVSAGQGARDEGSSEDGDDLSGRDGDEEDEDGDDFGGRSGDEEDEDGDAFGGTNEDEEDSRNTGTPDASQSTSSADQPPQEVVRIIMSALEDETYSYMVVLGDKLKRKAWMTYEELKDTDAFRNYLRLWHDNPSDHFPPEALQMLSRQSQSSPSHVEQSDDVDGSESDPEPQERARRRISRGRRATPQDDQPRESEDDSATGDDDSAKVDETLYVVERILKSDFNKRTKTPVYLVKWQGFSLSESTWEPYEELKLTRAFQDFYKKHKESGEHYFPADHGVDEVYGKRRKKGRPSKKGAREVKPMSEKRRERGRKRDAARAKREAKAAEKAAKAEKVDEVAET